MQNQRQLENQLEFAEASKLSKNFRESLLIYTKRFNSHNLNIKLIKKFMTLIKSDKVNKRGERTLRPENIAELKNTLLIEENNPQSFIYQNFRIEISGQTKYKAYLKFDGEFIPSLQIRDIPGATHAELHLALIPLNLEMKRHNTAPTYISKFYSLTDTSDCRQDMETPEIDADSDTVFAAVLFLSFYQEVNNIKYLLTNKKYGTALIGDIKASVPKENKIAEEQSENNPDVDKSTNISANNDTHQPTQDASHAVKPFYAATATFSGKEFQYKYLSEESDPLTNRAVKPDSGLPLSKRLRRRIKDNPKNPIEIPFARNQERTMDFMSDALSDGRKIRTLNVVDHFNRQCLGIEIGLNMPARLVIQAVEQMIEFHGKPKKIRTDNQQHLQNSKFETIFTNCRKKKPFTIVGDLGDVLFKSNLRFPFVSYKYSVPVELPASVKAILSFPLSFMFVIWLPV